MTSTTMTQENPKTISTDRKKELKHAARRGGVNDVDKRKQQDIADLNKMIAGASTLEEAGDIYQKLGEGLISPDMFRKLTKRFETAAPAVKKVEPAEETTAPEPDNLQGTVKTGQEESLISAYEEAPENTETVALRNVLASEISQLDKKLELLQELAVKANKKPATENVAEAITEALDELIAETRARTKGESVKEAIELLVLDGQGQVDPDLKTIYRARDKKEAINQCLDKTRQRLTALRQIDSGYDPIYELGRAYENGEILVADWTRIIEKQGLEISLLTKAEPEEAPVEDLANEAPDLLGFIQQNIQEQAQARIQQQAKRKNQPAASFDREEQAVRARMRRMAKMRQEGAGTEEIEAFEATEAKFEPTPEMLIIADEISRTQKTTEQQLHNIQALGQLDGVTLQALENLNFSLRYLESLRTNLRQVETIAREEFKDKREAAMKLLGRTDRDSEIKPWLYVKGNLPQATFGSKLQQALKNPVISKKKSPAKSASRKERSGKTNSALKRFTERVAEAFAEGSLSEKDYTAKKQLADYLAQSANPLEDLDNAFAAGTLQEVLTDKEYSGLRQNLK